MAFLDETGDSGRVLDGWGRLRRNMSRAFAVGGLIVSSDRSNTLDAALVKRAGQFYPDGLRGRELKGSELLRTLASESGKDRDRAEKYLHTTLAALARHGAIVTATVVLKDKEPGCPSRYALVRTATLDVVEQVERQCAINECFASIVADQHYHSSRSEDRLGAEIAGRRSISSVAFVDSRTSPMVRAADQVLSCIVMAIARTRLDWLVPPDGGFYFGASNRQVTRRSEKLADRLHQGLEQLTARYGGDSSLRVAEATSGRSRRWPEPRE